MHRLLDNIARFLCDKVEGRSVVVRSHTSIMCYVRTRSSASMQRSSLADDLIAEVTRQVGRGSKVNPASTEVRGQLRFHGRQCQVPGRVARLELDQQIDIAVRPGLVAQDGPDREIRAMWFRSAKAARTWPSRRAPPSSIDPGVVRVSGVARVRRLVMASSWYGV